MTTLTFKTEAKQTFLNKQKFKQSITLLICLRSLHNKSI